MGKWILKARNSLAAAGLWLAVFILPLKVKEFPAAFSWWLDMMPSTETLWMILSGVLVLWIFWIDVRGTIHGWLRKRRGQPVMFLAAFAEIVRNPLGAGTYRQGENIRQMKEIEPDVFMVEFQRPIDPTSLIVSAAGIEAQIIEKTARRVTFRAIVDGPTRFEFECADLDS